MKYGLVEIVYTIDLQRVDLGGEGKEWEEAGAV